MKLRHYALAAILVLTFFTLSCKRDEYKAPDLTGPAVNDLYLLINVNPTVVPAGGSASVRVRLMGAEGPVANAPVTFMVENAAGTAGVRNGEREVVSLHSRRQPARGRKEKTFRRGPWNPPVLSEVLSSCRVDVPLTGHTPHRNPDVRLSRIRLFIKRIVHFYHAYTLT